MSKIWRKCLVLLVSAGMILSLAACSGADKGSESKAAAETESAGTEASSEASEVLPGQYASAALRINEKKGAIVTVDLSGGCSVDFAYGAIYFYDNVHHLSEDDPVTAYGFIMDKQEYDEFIESAKQYHEVEETDELVKIDEGENEIRYMFPAGDDVYFSILASKNADADSIYARFKVSSEDYSAPVSGIDYTVLVNKLNPLPDTWEDELETVHFTNTVGDDVEVEKKAYDAYLQLKEALEAEDIHVDLDSARRSVAAQQDIMDRFIEKYGADYANKTVAQPGYSEHHTGLALDLYLIIDGKDVVENEDMIQYPEIWAKIHEKLADYGFILRYLEDKEHITGYSYEPWHIRYLDDPELAKYIMDPGLTLEEAHKGIAAPEVNIDYGSSEIFTEDEIKEAVIRIKCDFASWDGCELHSLKYAGDESNSAENIEWLNSLNEDSHYKQVAEFLGDLHSPVTDAGAWEPDTEYTDYQWWLGRTEDGSWDIVSTGY